MPPVSAETCLPMECCYKYFPFRIISGLEEKGIELVKVLPFLLILNSVYWHLTEQVGLGSS